MLDFQKIGPHPRFYYVCWVCLVKMCCWWHPRNSCSEIVDKNCNQCVETVLMHGLEIFVTQTSCYCTLCTSSRHAFNLLAQGVFVLRFPMVRSGRVRVVEKQKKRGVPSYREIAKRPRRAGQGKRRQYRANKKKSNMTMARYRGGYKLMCKKAGRYVRRLSGFPAKDF